MFLVMVTRPVLKKIGHVTLSKQGFWPYNNLFFKYRQSETGTMWNLVFITIIKSMEEV